MGSQRHYWQPSKKKEGNNKIYKLLASQYPEMKTKDIEALVNVTSEQDLKDYLISLGMTDKEIKKVLD
jgi:hypothetical protein